MRLACRLLGGNGPSPCSGALWLVDKWLPKDSVSAHSHLGKNSWSGRRTSRLNAIRDGSEPATGGCAGLPPGQGAERPAGRARGTGTAAGWTASAAGPAPSAEHAAGQRAGLPAGPARSAGHAAGECG
eukprot:2271056-Alexandrium_andersonii.AAC.1